MMRAMPRRVALVGEEGHAPMMGGRAGGRGPRVPARRAHAAARLGSNRLDGTGGCLSSTCCCVYSDACVPCLPGWGWWR